MGLPGVPLHRFILAHPLPGTTSLSVGLGGSCELPPLRSAPCGGPILFRLCGLSPL